MVVDGIQPPDDPGADRASTLCQRKGQLSMKTLGPHERRISADPPTRQRPMAPVSKDQCGASFRIALELLHAAACLEPADAGHQTGADQPEACGKGIACQIRRAVLENGRLAACAPNCDLEVGCRLATEKGRNRRAIR